ncbi:MAG: chaperone modulatory protein CbpM [Ascidiaceihabitans sp.]|jgi:chaperone modulatory protein CbpM
MKKTKQRVDIIDALSLHELCRFCQADEAWIIELVQHGVLEPNGTNYETWHFQGRNIVRAKKAHRLNHDLGINVAGVAMVLELLDERDALLRQLGHYELE